MTHPKSPPLHPLPPSLPQVRPEILASVDPEDVEAALRSALLKLQFLDAVLAPLPPGCTFEVIAYATARAALPPGSWVDADAGRAGAVGSYSDDSVSGSDGDGSASPGSPLSPLGGAGVGGAHDHHHGGSGGGHRHPFSPSAPGPAILPLKSLSAGGGALSLQVFVETDGPLGSRPDSPVGG